MIPPKETSNGAAPTRAEALTAAREYAFIIEEDPPYEYATTINDERLYRKIEPQGKSIVHCFIGGLGADWSLAAALEAIEEATNLYWVDHILDHDLVAVSPEGKERAFHVPAPWKRGN